jgi:PTH1 family peptidyl-tRNA hydrolase
MKLIVGLGNPEDKYESTRHNAGFRLLRAYVTAQGASFKENTRFKGQVAEIGNGDSKVIALLPTTYYNLTGEAVRAVADFYKIAPQDILVIHDELALPFGTVRTRLGGSSAGNNGIKSVNEHLGPDTARIRVGIWNELRDRMDDANFVLSNFSKEEGEALKDLEKKVFTFIDDFIAGKFAATTHR